MIRLLAVAAALAMAPALAAAPAALASERPGFTSKNFTAPPNTPSYFTNERAVPYMSMRHRHDAGTRPAGRSSPGAAVGSAANPAPSPSVDLAAAPPRPAPKPTPPPLEAATQAPQPKPQPAVATIELAAEPPRPAHKPAPPPQTVALATQPPRPARKPAPPPPRRASASDGNAPLAQVPVAASAGHATVAAAAVSLPPLATAVLAAGPAGWTERDGRPYNRRMAMTIPFRKMHGLGNDFVVLDARARSIRLDAAGARALADRRTGIGCDQVILLEAPRHPAAQALMRIRNADGGEVEACGNATRCIARLLARESGERKVRIETAAGVLEAEVLPDGRVAVDMGPARTGWREIPLARAMNTDRADLALGPLAAPACTNIGNPHATFFVADAEAVDLAAFGPVLETDPLFPERANIGVASILDPRHLRLRVWERGAGLTRACGTGACAAVVAAYRRGLAGRSAEVRLDGGSLDIAWGSDNHVIMTGPAALTYEGRFEPVLLSGGG